MPLRALLAAVLLILVAAAPASADLTRGTTRPLMLTSGKSHRLALPLPTVRQVPTITRHDGRIVVRARASYRAANWHKRHGVLRDRATVVLQVARRVLTTGPDPNGARYRAKRVHLLGARIAHRAYRWTLPRAVSRELIRAGAFSRDAERRALVRRRVWIDIEQDRDFQQVDGSYDWREGRAANASEHLPRRTMARAAASNNPGGTLTVQNATSWGFLAPGQVPIDASFYSAAPASTVNNSGVPLVMAAQAMQCFDSGASNSNPAGFANASGGTPQPYAPGATLQGQAYDAYPFSTGFAVSEPIAADDSIARASNNEQADTAAYVDGTLNLAFAAASVLTGGGTPSGFLGGTDLGFLITGALDVDTIPSPGTIVSAFVDIADAIIASSCDGNANLMGIAAVEPGGGTVASNTQIQENAFGPFDPQNEETSNNVGYTAPITGLFGLQVNRSTSTYGGAPLYLNPYFVGSGVSPNSLAGSGDNYLGMEWVTSNPCTWYGQPATACTALPADSPVVVDDALNLDCGAGNLQCPFPDAGFPPGTTSLPSAASVAPPSTTTISGTSTVSASCGTEVPPSSAAYGAGSAVFSPNGDYELLMTSAGVLELIDTDSDQITWLAPTISANANTGPTAGSTWSVLPNGTFAITDGPGGSGTAWSVGSSAAGSSLVVQNDGNLVLYNPAGTSALWSSGTADPTVTPCLAPNGVQQVLTSSCATLIPAGTYPPGSSFASPNGSVVLTMMSNGALSVLYNGSFGLWNSAQSSQPPGTGYNTTPEAGDSMIVTDTGGLLVGMNATFPTFDANVSGNGVQVAIQNDGNLVVYSGTGTALWATGTTGGVVGGPTCPPPTLAPAS